MSISEQQSSNDLKHAMFVLHKLGDTFKSFHSHAFSIVTLGDQWQTFHNSLAAVHNSLENRLKELETKEVEIAATTIRFQNLEKNFELRERFLTERAEALDMKENQIKDWCEGIVLERKAFEERCTAVEVREKRCTAVEESEVEAKKFEERCRVVEVREMEINEREGRCCARAKEIAENAYNLELKEKMIDERKELVEVREMNVSKREERCNVREKEIEEKKEKLEVKEIELSDFSEELNKRLLVLKQKEEEFEDKKQKLASKEEDMDELYDVLESKEKELNEGNKMLKEVDEKLKGIALKEKELNEKLKGIALKEKELNEKLMGIELKERQIVERYQVLEAKEKAIRDSEEKLVLKEVKLNVGWKKLEIRDKVVREKFRAWEAKEKQINEKAKELDLREKELNEKKRKVDDRQQRIEVKEKKLEMKEKKEVNESLGRHCKYTKLREEEMNNDVSKKLELKEKDMDDRFKMLESKEKQIKEQFKVIEMKEKQVDDRKFEIESKEKEIDRRFQELDAKKKHINDLCEQIEECSKVMEMKEKDEMELYQKQVDKGHESLGLKERKMKERSEASETKENHVVDERKAQESTNTQIKEKQNREACLVEDYTEKQSDEQIESSSSQEIPHSEVPQAACVNNSSGKIGGDIHILCKNMDPGGVKSYLIERWMERKLIHEELLDALKSAPDPAKLVLDVFQKYYYQFTTLDEARATNIVCRILLENLVKLSPLIALSVKDEAKVLADSWNARLKGVDNPTDTYGFLLFVAAFQLASLYDAEELLSLFDIFYRSNVVYRPDDNPFLCRALGLSNKIPGIINSLVQRQKWVLALKYIHVFKLESDFPPVPLLEAHLELIRKRAIDGQRDGTFESQMQSYHMELESLVEVVSCVRKLKLELKFPIDSLVSHIQNLEKAIDYKKHFALPRMKRGASYCASVEYTHHQEKRPRVGHDIHPNWHQGIAYASYGPSYNEFHLPVGFGQLVSPRMHPFGAPQPVCYDDPFLGPLG